MTFITGVRDSICSLPQLVQPVADSEGSFNGKLEQMSKWWLELLRNAMVVGAVTALAERSGSLLLTFVAWVSSIALVVFAMSRLLKYRVDFGRGERADSFIGWVSAIFTIYMALALSMSVGTAFKVLFNAVSAMKS